MDLVGLKIQNEKQGSEIWYELQPASSRKKEICGLQWKEKEPTFLINIYYLVQNYILTQILEFSVCAEHHFQVTNEHGSLRPQSLFGVFFFICL